MLTSLTRTLLNVIGTLPFMPAGLRDRAAGAAAQEVGDPIHRDVVAMSDDQTALHPEAGTSCAACGRAFRTTDPVRRTGKGVVHDVCPS